MDIEKNADQLAEEYIDLRTQRSILTKEFEEKDGVLSAQMEAISNKMLEMCEQANATSIRTEHGTITRKIHTRYSTTDWGSMYEVINKYHAPHLLEKRITASAMKEFLEEYPEAYPPGMYTDNKYIISVMKPRKKV